MGGSVNFMFSCVIVDAPLVNCYYNVYSSCISYVFVIHLKKTYHIHHLHHIYIYIIYIYTYIIIYIFHIYIYHIYIYHMYIYIYISYVSYIICIKNMICIIYPRLWEIVGIHIPVRLST